MGITNDGKVLFYTSIDNTKSNFFDNFVALNITKNLRVITYHKSYDCNCCQDDRVPILHNEPLECCYAFFREEKASQC